MDSELRHARTAPLEQTYSPSRSSTSSTLSSDLATLQLDYRSSPHHDRNHIHVETPYPRVEHAATWDVSLNKHTSFFDSHKHHHHPHLEHVPNPLSVVQHTVEDHIAEFQYGHTVRKAKRDAKRLSDYQAHSKLKRVSQELETLSEYGIPEEHINVCAEKDALAWAEELKKREAAKTSGEFGWSGGWTLPLRDGIDIEKHT